VLLQLPAALSGPNKQLAGLEGRLAALGDALEEAVGDLGAHKQQQVRKGTRCCKDHKVLYVQGAPAPEGDGSLALVLACQLAAALKMLASWSGKPPFQDGVHDMLTLIRWHGRTGHNIPWCLFY
jgi:hypothetical protein